MSGSGIPPETEDRIASLFADFFGRMPPHLPLVVTPGYRGQTSGTHRVSMPCTKPCASCAGKGCRACRHVGWTVGEERFDVEVPAGSTPGQRIRLEGKASSKDAFDPMVELVEEGSERAAELAAAVRAHREKLLARFDAAAAEKAKARRETYAKATIAVITMALLLVLATGRQLAKSRVGEPCERADDCRSGQCLATESRSARFCTEACAIDEECPRGMECRSVQVSSTAGIRRADAMGARVCMPRP